MNRALLIVLAASIAASACQSERPTEPLSPAAPQPKAPSGSSATITRGVYRLLAPITLFDPIWGDFTGYAYAATMVVQHHATDPARIVGTFSDFVLLDAEGTPENWSHAGIVRGFVDGPSQVTLELSAYNGNFTWWGRGAVGDGRVDGSWGRGGHFAGAFSAVLSK